MFYLILLIAAVLTSSGIFSGSEAALISLSEAEVEELVNKKRFGARILLKINRSLDRSVTAILILNNIVNIVGSILVGQMVVTLYGDSFLAIVTTGLTFGVIVFSEIIPKNLGIHYAQVFAPLVAPLIWALTRLFLPFILVVEKAIKMLKKGERKIGTEQQIRSLVTKGRKEGHIESDEGQLIHRAFILNDKTAADIMTPLKDIVGITENMTVKEAAAEIEKKVHTRYPVFGSSIHDIKGIIIRKEILETLLVNQGNKPVTEIIREPLIVPSAMRSDRLLVLFRDKHIHLAVVQQDEHTVGLVTLEDVLEELVGEIEDEADMEE